MAEKNEPVAVGSLLEAVLGPVRFGQLRQQQRLVAAWEELAGPKLAAKVRPVALVGGVLWLEADSPPYAQEAQLRSARLMDACNRLLGEGAVSEVRVGKRQPAARPRPPRPRNRS